MMTTRKCPSLVRVRVGGGGLDDGKAEKRAGGRLQVEVVGGMPSTCKMW